MYCPPRLKLLIHEIPKYHRDLDVAFYHRVNVVTTQKKQQHINTFNVLKIIQNNLGIP